MARRDKCPINHDSPPSEIVPPVSHRLVAGFWICTLLLPPSLAGAPTAEEPDLPFLLAQNEAENVENPGVLAPPDNVETVAPPLENNGGALPGIENAVGNSIIAGEVSDATTLDPLEGVIIDVIGTGRTAVSDAKGRFKLEGFAPGTYNLEASQLGYFVASATVTTLEGQTAEARFGMRIKPIGDAVQEYMLEEETVVGEYREDDAAGALDLDLASTTSIASGVSKDDFTKSGISDAGDAVSKISGANIVGGKYAVVRGLGDRYSNTLVNGALISSADPSKKAVQLDLFPSDLLESISIYKTFSPEFPAEFAGGTVFIKTLQFPDHPIVEFEYGQKFNSQLKGDFYGSGDDLGLFGLTDDSLPSAVPSLASKQFTPGVTSGRPPSETNATAQKAIEQATALHLSSALRPEKRDSHVPESFGVTLGNTFDLGNNLELGVVLAGTSSNGDEAIRGVTVGRSLNPGDDGLSGTGDDYLNRTQEEDRYTAYAGYGILGSIGLRAGKRHSINFTAFQNHRAEDEVIQARKIHDDTSGSGQFQEFAGPGSINGQALQSTPYGATAATYQALDSTIPLRRTLTLIQGSGHHEIGNEEMPIELDWLYSRSRAVEERPSTRTVFFSQLDFTDPRIQNIDGAVYDPSLGEVYTLSDIYSINPALNKTYREMLSTREDSANSRLDLTVPVWSENDDFFKLKLGGNLFDRNRESRGRLFTYTIGQALNEELANADGGQYGQDYLDMINGTVDPNGDPIFNGHANNNLSDGIYITENTTTGNTVRNVDADTSLEAAYLQGNLELGRWILTGGVRYEAEARSYEVLAGLNPAGSVVPKTTVSNDYFLPGITLQRDFGLKDQFTGTFAWSRTVARPTFFEFAPIRTVDQASGDTFQGNPDLTDTLIDNYDLRLDWRPDGETSLGVSLFHKNLDSPIAQAYRYGDRTFINGNTGTIQGIELEMQKRFLEHWTITSNYTYIKSLLEFDQQTVLGSQTIRTTFDGQPNHIFNLAFGWDDVDLGMSATLNYNLTGSYLTAVPLGADEPPVRRDTYHQLDLILQKRIAIGESVGIVKLNFGNILNSTDRQTFDGTDLVYSSYRRGRTYGLEFEYQF
ncbi:outer membrane beta-barrel protein [Luteolibacter pohnpeiensis]|uniref:Outer membrane beta-barrel protein n=1 Tax=Luteolibacter pohnpeiensis TaxID=454153 RepID=A0A934S7N5_9BACT|nr:outer membrane beta-barrel protein [Luteolibacter pohnpeiensis]MBK1884201.1 outer membrane beta-barrel protein [Luteolibacter pohnpeiensis]